MAKKFIAPYKRRSLLTVQAAPRWPNGTINLGAPPGQVGMWDGGEPLTTIPSNYEKVGGRPRPGLVHLDQIPIQPWAKALLDARHERFLADEPYTRCKPSPAARAVQTAYGIEFLNLPGAGRIYLFQTGGAHSFRLIYLDGRSHPAGVESSYFGHSIGWWDGDTLVIDTVGFNEGAWMERWGMPHTDRLHTIERITRLDFDTLSAEDVYATDLQPHHRVVHLTVVRCRPAVGRNGVDRIAFLQAKQASTGLHG